MHNCHAKLARIQRKRSLLYSLSVSASNQFYVFIINQTLKQVQGDNKTTSENKNLAFLNTNNPELEFILLFQTWLKIQLALF